MTQNSWIGPIGLGPGSTFTRAKGTVGYVSLSWDSEMVDGILGFREEGLAFCEVGCEGSGRRVSIGMGCDGAWR